MKLTWIDATKWAGVAAVIGTVLGVFLSDSAAESTAYYAEIGQAVLVALAAAAGSFALALRQRK